MSARHRRRRVKYRSGPPGALEFAWPAPNHRTNWDSGVEDAGAPGQPQGAVPTMMRIVLLLATNVAVMVVASIIFNLFGLNKFTAQYGIDYGGMLVFCALFGFGGAFVSLAMSKWVAKRSTGAQVITQPRNDLEAWLFRTVQRQAEKAGIGMPEVAIYDAPEMNAFATGMSRNNALVAVSTGLLRQMDRREVEAVLGHEIGHVANGDMVTLTLIQGVVNTFVMFFARIIGNFIDRAILKNEDGPGLAYFLCVMVLEIVFGILASVVVAWFSRRREFRADAAGASLEGREAMIAALARLKAGHEPSSLPKEIAAFGISGGIGKLFASHPPLDERIEALRRAA
jgi:heat shock protein HtpX